MDNFALYIGADFVVFTATSLAKLTNRENSRQVSAFVSNFLASQNASLVQDPVHDPGLNSELKIQCPVVFVLCTMSNNS